MDKNTKLGAVLGAALTAASCAAPQEKPDIDQEIRSVSATMINAKTGQMQEISNQPVQGENACRDFADIIASSGFNVEADCLNGAGETVKAINIEYIEPEKPEEPAL